MISLLQGLKFPGKMAQVNAIKVGSLALIITLGGTLIQQIEIAMMLLLGIMAAALSETPCHFKTKLKTFALLTASFFLTITLVQALSSIPWLFVIGLGLATFIFVMLAALGESFRAVGFSSLIIAIYTLLSTQVQIIPAPSPLWLLAGAALYLLYAFIWQLFLTHFSLRQQLADLFYALSYYQREKSRLYDVSNTQLPQIRFKLAEKNRLIVNELELCRTLLLLDERRFAGDTQYRYWYHLYMVAQRLHESSASSHLSNLSAREQVLDTPVAPLIRKMLLQLAVESRNLAQALEKNRFFTPSHHLESQLTELNTALADLKYQQKNGLNVIAASVQNQDNDGLAPLDEANSVSLSSLGKNLGQMVTLYRKGIFASTPEKFTIPKPEKISAWRQVKTQLSFTSPLLRHAIRLTLCLCSGYVIARTLFDSHGFWILLSSLIICRPDFASSVRRLGSRVVGTFAGVFTLAYILPLLDQSWFFVTLPVFCISAFFLFFRSHYAIAVFFVTWLAGLFFHLQDPSLASYNYYRLSETLIGAALAITALLFIWPDWKTRRLDLLCHHALAQLKHYLDAIVEQFDRRADREEREREEASDSDVDTDESGEEQSDYRQARRDVHTAEARLLDTLSSIALEPNQSKSRRRALHEFTMAYHQILSYSSAIASHKQDIDTKGKLKPVINTVTGLLTIFQDYVMANSDTLPSKDHYAGLHQQLSQLLTQLNGQSLLVCYQLQQIALVLEKMAGYVEKIRGDG